MEPMGGSGVVLDHWTAESVDKTAVSHVEVGRTEGMRMEVEVEEVVDTADKSVMACVVSEHHTNLAGEELQIDRVLEK